MAYRDYSPSAAQEQAANFRVLKEFVAGSGHG
jgi:hypothetical protein